MLQSIQNGYEFERTVCKILYKTNPYQLSYYDGGADRGRDICVEYRNDGRIYNVIVECKFYNSGVNKEIIMSALNWATVHQPELLYLWIVPYLTPSAKDFVNAFKEKYKIPVIIEEKINIEEYLKYIYDNEARIWSSLRQRIIASCADKYGANRYIPEYELDKPENSPFLIDRESERKTLFNHQQNAFYLQGVSASGKTQLLKYVAFIYTQKGSPVFWYTIRPCNVDQQCSDFFHTLARYFESVHQDNALLDYFSTYGMFLSQDMENLIIDMLNKYNPILFIDDAHNCQNENISLRALLTKLITHKTCRVYFSGWFNIFNFSIIEKNYITTIILDGMKKDELNLIIKYCSGEYYPEAAELIEQQLYGLPGYAVLADKNINIDDINGADDFIAHFLTLLTQEEQVVLFALSFLSTDVPGGFLQKLGYSMQLISLENKHLLVNRKYSYTVHDKYRAFFSKCIIKESLASNIISLIDRYASVEPSAYLDLINFRIYEKNYTIAWEIISNRFQLLISCQFYTSLLKQLQEIEQHTQGIININDIVIKKIVLLERLNKYNLCLKYIRLLGDMSIFSSLDQETIFYIQLRCLYFTNQYDEILKLYNDNYLMVESFTDKELYIQILLTIGRVFYIRGSSIGALIYYLLSYEYANELHKKTLEVKAIHRIAMIERRLGLAVDSRKTFLELLKLDTLTTPKRRSYICFRIAKCFYNEGNLEKAKEYNNKSIKIKESYNDIRGLLFSENLSALICLKEKNYMEAYGHSAQACEYADSMDLHKEWLSAALVKLRIILDETSDNFTLSDIGADLQRGLRIATDEKLLLRLKSIEDLTVNYWSDLYFVAKQNREIVESELKIFEKKILEYYIMQQDSNINIQQAYETLMIRKEPISQSLLMRSGFLDPLLVCQ